MRRRNKKPVSQKLILPVLLALVLSFGVIGGTVAFLIAKTDSVANKFTPAKVSCEVTEDFDGTVKSNVNVTNTGDTAAFIRVKLISYRVNDNGAHIGGTASVPAFTVGYGWVEHEGFYYYTSPVAPEGQPTNALIGSTGITLVTYNDADGGKQVIEVMAEAIQSTPAEAVGQAWGVSITQGAVAAYTAG